MRITLVVLAALALVAYPLLYRDNLAQQNTLILTFLLAIMASSWNIISGFTGYVSLGHSAFLGIGAYTVALLAVRVDVSPFMFVPLAGVVAAAFAAIVGAAVMRTRGHSFVILTIAFLFLMQLVVLNTPSITNGSHGLTLPLPQWSSEYLNVPFYYAMFAVMLLTILLSWWIRRTKFGMGLVAIRDDEDKAATVGVNTPVYKILSFVASAVFVGVAGGIFAYYLSFVEPRSMFDILISVQIVLATLLGGRGTIWGPVLGAFLLQPLIDYANRPHEVPLVGFEIGGGNYRLVLYGGLMALVVIFLPRGIIPSTADLLRRRREGGRAALVGARLERRIAPVAREPVAPRADARPLLEVKGLEKRFGGLRALDACDFSVPEGSITGLIGPNGSGKTTAFNVIGGTMDADAGEVWLDGRRIDGLPPWERAYLGLGRTFQITRLFRQMTVLENVVSPLSRFSWLQMTTDAVSGREAKRAEELLDFVGMLRFRDHSAGELSYGQQKLVELAQVLMLDPRLILLDEPAGGINPTLIEQIVDMIRELNAQGKTFLIVEHNMPMVLGLCDPVLVLARGGCICRGTPAEIQRDPAVLDAYLGEDYSAGEPAVAS